MKEAILLLGSNLGNTEKNISEAISYLENNIGKIIKRSKLLKTLPVEFVSQYIFCNIAVVLETNYSPVKLLNQLKDIEKQMGRMQDSRVLGEYRDRIIDIDIVEYDGVDFKSDNLTLPHYRHLYEREFSKLLLEDIKK